MGLTKVGKFVASFKLTIDLEVYRVLELSDDYSTFCIKLPWQTIT
jgi:hypothetical protein